jgi:hypothetical protein
LHATSLKYAENLSESLSKANLVLTTQGEKKASKGDPWKGQTLLMLLYWMERMTGQSLLPKKLGTGA